MSIKGRRKALGWDRRELAERAGLDPHVVQLAELEQWAEPDALGRLEYVLKCAEDGDLDVRLGKVSAPEGQQIIGHDGAAEEGAAEERAAAREAPAEEAAPPDHGDNGVSGR